MCNTLLKIHLKSAVFAQLFFLLSVSCLCLGTNRPSGHGADCGKIPEQKSKKGIATDTWRPVACYGQYMDG